MENQTGCVSPSDGASCSDSSDQCWGKFLEDRGISPDQIPYSELSSLNNEQALEKCNDIVVENGGQQFLFNAPTILDGLISVIGLEVDPSNPQLL